MFIIEIIRGPEPILAPLAPWVLPVLGMAATFATGLFNNKRQKQTNIENRQFAREMDDRARRYALDDWNRTNEYNSPEQQVNRLRQAGLNPHLVYGKGADNTANMVKSSQGMQGNAQAPQFNDFGDVLGKYYQVRNQKLQTDMLSEQVGIKQKERAMLELKIIGQEIANETNKERKYQLMQMRDSIIKEQKWKADKAEAVAYHEIESMSKTIEQANNEKLKGDLTKQQIEYLKKQNEILKDKKIVAAFHAELAKKGLTPNDGFYKRGFISLLEDYLNMPNPFRELGY